MQTKRKMTLLLLVALIASAPAAWAAEVPEMRTDALEKVWDLGVEILESIGSHVEGLLEAAAEFVSEPTVTDHQEPESNPHAEQNLMGVYVPCG